MAARRSVHCTDEVRQAMQQWWWEDWKRTQLQRLPPRTIGTLGSGKKVDCMLVFPPSPCPPMLDVADGQWTVDAWVSIRQARVALRGVRGGPFFPEGGDEQSVVDFMMRMCREPDLAHTGLSADRIQDVQVVDREGILRHVSHQDVKDGEHVVVGMTIFLPNGSRHMNNR